MAQAMAGEMIVHTDRLDIGLRIGPDVADITDALARIVAASGVRVGSVHVCALGSTASITTIEYEPGAVEDFKRAIERLAPPGANYAHEMTWHDGNGHSHVQAALLGPSIVVPIRDHGLALGTWQQVVLVNHDIHARRRSVEVTVLGSR